MSNNDKEFYKEVDFLFETYLSPKRDGLKIRVKDSVKDKIFDEHEMNYSKVFFDTELNIYKIDKDGKIVRVDNPNFEAVVMRKD